MSTLALRGASPVSSEPWPQWPQHDDETEAAVAAAVRSGRWTLTAPHTGSEPYERRFASRFAEHVGVPYCVSTDHGSSALALALQALGIGPGDEVVVPVLTWVATATAVLTVGAVPVFADVDRSTGCLAPDSVMEVLTERTRALLPVHLNCRMADVDALGAIARARHLVLIEDCAQSHGARWSGAMAGSFGAAGAFSMQQGKVLTCGEGGAVTTGDAEVYDRLQQLRADSRRYADPEPAPGQPYLAEAADVMGANHCLGELQAALLLDQLGRLDGQLERRAEAAAVLDERLGQLEAVDPLSRDDRLQRPSVFAYAVRRRREAFAGRPTEVVCEALGRELGVRVRQTDRPLHANPLYRPWTNPRFRAVVDAPDDRPPGSFASAEALYDELILLPHQLLLSPLERMDEIVEAFAKVAAHPEEL